MSCFITLEGPDGSGKTTQVRKLYDTLLRAGYPVLLLHEPGSTAIGDQIRRILHDPANTEMQPNAEVLLYSASRAQLVGQVILPALSAGQVVLCDRYAQSTLAYQGYGHGLDLDALKAITRFATHGLQPDLIVYLDIDPSQGLTRKLDDYRKGEGEWNRMDQKEVEFHRRVREGYLRMAAQEPHRWFVLDATQPIQAVSHAIADRVVQVLEARGIRPSAGPQSASGKETCIRETRH